MRTLTVVILTSLAFSYAGATGAKAAPWCAYYGEGTTSCGFMTVQQCEANVSGVGGFCSRNPGRT